MSSAIPKTSHFVKQNFGTGHRRKEKRGKKVTNLVKRLKSKDE